MTAHWRMVVAAGLVLVLVISLGTWWVVVHRAVEQDAGVDCSTLESESPAGASALAHACGAEVEILADRTPWETTWATPENASHLEVSTLPVRVQDANGEWTALDTSIVADQTSGSLVVKAPVFPMEINSGGAAGRGKPLGSITRDGMTFQVWFPLDLPVPEVSDTQVVYTLGSGIRLLLTINVDGSGFLPVVELDSPDAATRFEAMLDAMRPDVGALSHDMDLEFGTAASKGLSLSLDDEFAVHVVDAKGDSQFLASPPVMWDSSGASSPVSSTATEVGVVDRAQSPADGDHIAMMGVELAADGTIVVSPDKAMISSPDTVWPIYIDPQISGKTASSWVAVRSGGYTSTLYKWTDISPSMLGQGTGYCSQASSCNVVFKQRLAWEYSGLDTIADSVGTDITSATFEVYGAHSYNCTAQKTNLVRTSDVSSSSTWSNLTFSSTVVGSRTEYHSVNCGKTGLKAYNALTAVQWAADNDKTVLDLGLKVDESAMAYWKRFRASAKLNIVYDHAPNIPTNQQLSLPSVTLCTTGASRPVIATTTPKLSAISTDPDAPGTPTVRTDFVVTAAGNHSDIKWSTNSVGFVKSGDRAETTVPLTKVVGTTTVPILVSGGVYAWQANAYDGTRSSATNPEWCEFAVDTSMPQSPTVTPVADATVQAVYEEGVERGGKDLIGKFVIDRSPSTDVVQFEYWFDSPAFTETGTPDSNGKLQVTFPAGTTGPHSLTVKSKDSAGNTSAPTVYSFDVASPTEDAIWTLDEGEGSTAADSAGSSSGPLAITGATWTVGPHTLFDSRDGDTALSFNGTSDFAVAGGPVVDTLGSFVVSAHVRLNASSIAQGQSFTALSQDGVTGSGFRLEYDATCSGQPDGCWSFAMPDALDDPDETAVTSTVPVVGDEWTYLVGEHDAAHDTLNLWVCPIGTPKEPAVGEPIKSSVSRSVSPWAAAGAFAVGRGLDGGANSNWWPGAVDNIRIFKGEVVDEAKIRRLCQGAEATDFTGDGSELDPTVEEVQ
jgi:hypothetical protein